jgi:hypothetical protein
MLVPIIHQCSQLSHFSSCLTVLVFISEAEHNRPCVLELAQGAKSESVEWPHWYLCIIRWHIFA